MALYSTLYDTVYRQSNLHIVAYTEPGSYFAANLSETEKFVRCFP